MALSEQEIGARLRLRDRGTFVRDADQAGDAIERLDRRTRSAGVGAGMMSAAWSGLARGIGTATRIVATAGAAVAAVGIGVGAAFVKMGVQTMVAWEQSTVAFATMLGSKDKAVAMMAELRKFAIATPFEMPQLVTAARNLRAMGWEAEKIIPTLKIIGDTASGLGLDSEGVVRIGRALGEMRAKGFASGEEMRQLANHGIRAWEYLAKYVGKSIPETMKLAEKRQIDGSKAVSAILAGMAKEHGGLMAAQMTTIGGKWMMLKDQIRFAAMDMMKPFEEDIKHAMDWATANVGRFTNWIVDNVGAAFAMFKWGRAGVELNHELNTILQRFYYLGRLVEAIMGRDVENRWKAAGDAIKGIIDPTGRLNGLFDKGGEILTDLWTIWTQGILPAYRDFGPVVAGILSPISLLDDALGFLADHTWGVHQAMVILLGILAANAVIRAYTKGIIGIAGWLQRWKDGTTAARDATILLKTATVATARWIGFAGFAVKYYTVLLWEQFTAQMSLAVAYARAKIAAVASWVATKALTAAVWLQTAAQWALNAAMYANPIGLVVLAVVAFIAILALLYFKVKPVRDAIDWLWQTIQKGWDWIQNHQGIVAVFLGPLGPVFLLVSNLKDVWQWLNNIYNLITGNKDVKVNILGFELSNGPKKGLKVDSPGWLQGAWRGIKGGFKGAGPTLFGIPGLASGGEVMKGGRVLVGENGPEVADLNVGATVRPLKDVQIPDSEAVVPDRYRGIPAALQVKDGARVLFELVTEQAGDTAARI